jgi:molybdopterin molybdotransferase
MEVEKDCCSSPGLLPMEDAMEQMRQAVKQVIDIETVEVIDALDRVLAEDIVSNINVPPHANSAMDGYAFRAEDKALGKSLHVVGKSLAGHPYVGSIVSGQAIRIMTGAQLPEGADSVMMQENIQRDGDQIELLKWPEVGNSIRNSGEDIKQGETVLKAGVRLSPIDLGLLASLGKTDVKVFCKLKVAVLSSGDELARAGEPLPSAGIYESNSMVTLSVLKRLGCITKDLGIVADDPEKLHSAFSKAMQWADVLITSGGVSVGDADYIKQVLGQMGSIGFWKLAIKPGKPFAFGKLDDCIFFGLPGNPVSAMVTLHQLVVPMIQLMQGETRQELPSFKMKLSSKLRKVPGRKDFQRARLIKDENGNNQINLFRTQGSGVLTSMSESNCYLVLDIEQQSLEPGDEVDVVAFDRWIGR